ncbi:Tetratricopeptide repeat protein [compost metagenome]
MRSTGQTVQLDSWADQGHWLLLPLLLLAACAGRRGWLFCLPLLLCLPQPGYAFELDDLWLRPDQQGQRLLERQQPAAAARRFQDPQWKGLALYEAGDYSAAAQQFAQGNSASAHYNRGNALARSGELEAALDAYEQALERQPDLQPALQNQALVESLLQESRQQAAAEAARKEQSAQEQAEQNAQADANADTQAQQQPGASESTEQKAGEPSDEQGKAQASDTATKPGSGEGDDEQTTRPPAYPSASSLDSEQRQALEQWLRQIPDEPAELLRRKFWYEQQQHQEPTR